MGRSWQNDSRILATYTSYSKGLEVIHGKEASCARAVTWRQGSEALPFLILLSLATRYRTGSRNGALPPARRPSKASSAQVRVGSYICAAPRMGTSVRRLVGAFAETRGADVALIESARNDSSGASTSYGRMNRELRLATFLAGIAALRNSIFCLVPLLGVTASSRRLN